MFLTFLCVNRVEEEEAEEKHVNSPKTFTKDVIGLPGDSFNKLGSDGGPRG
jgi:hypothetical protein